MSNARSVGAWRIVWVATWLSTATIATAEGQGHNVPPCPHAVLTLAEAAELLRADTDDVERLAATGEVPGRRVGTDWRFSCAALITWLHGTAPDTSVAAITARGIGWQNLAGAQSAVVSPRTGTSQEPAVGEAPQERSAEDVFLRGQRLLLGPGDVVIDVGQFFSRRDDLLLLTTSGAAALATLEQRALSTLLVGRIGIFNETELFVGTSYHTQNSRQSIGQATISRDRRAAFGATTVGIRRTLLRERAKRPDVIATFSGQVPTDAIPGAASIGAALIKSVDPVVLFANASYFHAFRHESGNVPAGFRSADGLELSMGYGLGLNDTVAVSMAVAGASVRTTDAGIRFTQPSVFNIRFGLTAWLARKLYIEPSVSFGLTGPGETVSFGVTLPYAF